MSYVYRDKTADCKRYNSSYLKKLPVLCYFGKLF